MLIRRRPRVVPANPDLTITDVLFTRTTYRQPAVPAPTVQLTGLHADELRRGDHVVDPTHPRGGYVVAVLISGSADGTTVVVSAHRHDLSVVAGPDDRFTAHRARW